MTVTAKQSFERIFKLDVQNEPDIFKCVGLNLSQAEAWLAEDAPIYVAHIHCFKGETHTKLSLEGWSQKSFLILRSYALCKWLKKNKVTIPAEDFKAAALIIKLNLLAFWILKNNTQNLKNLSKSLADWLDKKQKPVLLASGYKGHATYTYIKKDGERFIVYVYNTGSMSAAHSGLGSQIYPYMGNMYIVNHFCRSLPIIFAGLGR